MLALMLAGCRQQPMILTVVVTQPPRVITATPTIECCFDAFDIVVCLPTEPVSLNPYTASSLEEREILASMLQGWLKDITGYSADIFEAGEYPSFANGDMISSGQDVEITLKFRHEMYWSDGKPFKVDDLLLTYDYLTSQQQLQNNPTNIHKIDDLGLHVIYRGESRSEHDILYEVLANLTPPLPSHAKQGGESVADFFSKYYAELPEPTLGPYGTGYESEWVRDDHIRLDSSYWRPGVKTPNLVFRFLPDEAERLASTLAYECDYSIFYQPSETLINLVQNVSNRGLVSNYLDPSPIPTRLDVYHSNLCGLEPDASKPMTWNVEDWYFIPSDQECDQ
jgi:ABC-type transport system substrate-binding protein